MFKRSDKDALWLFTPEWGLIRPHLKAAVKEALTPLIASNSSENFHSGYAEYKWDDGSSYKGNWSHGRFHGTGTFVFSDGESFTGEWEHGLKHGHGTYTWKNGDKYIGSFINDKRSGKGSLTWSESNPNHPKIEFLDKFSHSFEKKFEGQWDNDLPLGSGIKTCRGLIVSGWYENGHLNGYGKVSFADGSVYEGGFKDSKYHGYGKLVSKDGFGYEGEFDCGEKSGHGVQSYSNGSKFDGEWRAGEAWGKGVMMNQEGTVFIVQMEQGLVKSVALEFKTQDVFCRKILKGSIQPCLCIANAAQRREGFSTQMLAKNAYPFCVKIEAGFYVGRENLRRFKGAPQRIQ